MASTGHETRTEPRSAISASEQLTALHRRNYVPLLRLATALIDEEARAEEIVQEAFTRLVRGWSRLREPAAAEFYLRRAVVNGAHDELRSRRVRRAFRAPAAEPVLSSEEEAIAAEAHRRLLAALRELPRRQREVLVLRYFAGLSEEEIATTLGCRRGTVKSASHRGISALRVALGPVLETMGNSE